MVNVFLTASILFHGLLLGFAIPGVAGDPDSEDLLKPVGFDLRTHSKRNSERPQQTVSSLGPLEDMLRLVKLISVNRQPHAQIVTRKQDVLKLPEPVMADAIAIDSIPVEQPTSKDDGLKVPLSHSLGRSCRYKLCGSFVGRFMSRRTNVGK